MEKLYINIKERRTALGMTQQDLAEKMGYRDRSSIAKIESGEVDLSQSRIIMFAKALDTTPSDLMGMVEQGEPYQQEQELCDLFSLCYGKDSYRMVKAFLELDDKDRLVIYGEILGMLKADKYDKDSETDTTLYADAAHERTDIPYNEEYQKFDNDIMDDDNF